MSSRRGLEIRAAATTDSHGLAELLASAGVTLSPTDIAGRVEAIRQGPGTVLLALEWGPPTGVVALHWFSRLDMPRPTAQIDLLLVGAGERRRGIGRLLVKAASQAARVAGCGSLYLSSGSDQVALHAFCRATGFVDLGTRFERALRKSAAD